MLDNSYDGKGLRVLKTVSGMSTVYVYSGGSLIAEYDNGAGIGTPSREYIYSGGARVAKLENGATTYFHQDHLSARVLTNGNGTVVGELGHYPFGEKWYETGTTTKQKFTTYDRDSETGNDYTTGRTYASNLGRFLSPDIAPANLADPQSWNRYTYVENDPVNGIDPSGWCSPPDGNVNSGGGICDPGEADRLGLWTDPFNFMDRPIGYNLTFEFVESWVLRSVTPIYGQAFWFDTSGLSAGIPGGDPFAGLLPNPQPPPPPNYKKCITGALEEMVAHDEGTADQPNDGYGTLVGGRVISAPQSYSGLKVGRYYSTGAPWNMSAQDVESLTAHPNILVDATVSNSTAFGRYMFNVGTWNQFGTGGPTHDAQDQAMERLMNRLGMIDDAMSGQIVQAIWDGNTRWAGLPDSPFNQHPKSWAETIKAFQDAMNYLPKCQ